MAQRERDNINPPNAVLDALAAPLLAANENTNNAMLDAFAAPLLAANENRSSSIFLGDTRVVARLPVLDELVNPLLAGAYDSPASQRADLLSQIHSAQNDLDQLLAQLGSDAGSLLAEGLAKRELLARLERTLTSGVPVPVASVRGEIAGLVASTAALAQQARAANDQSSGSALATAQARARATVLEIGRDIYERHIFDPYLRFASPDDESAYRRREGESRRATERALAEHTPEGDLRAARLIQHQLADAGAHGADASPDFADRMSRINRDIGGLERAAAPRLQEQPDSQRENAGSSATSQSAPPASEEQLASVLATFRAVGIAGGVTAEQSAHGLSVDGSSPGQSQTART
jgi:hypothetical protein